MTYAQRIDSLLRRLSDLFRRCAGAAGSVHTDLHQRSRRTTKLADPRWRPQHGGSDPLSGALIGFCAAAGETRTVANAVNLIDLVLFAVPATVVQLVVFVFARMLMPG